MLTLWSVTVWMTVGGVSAAENEGRGEKGPGGGGAERGDCDEEDDESTPISSSGDHVNKKKRSQSNNHMNIPDEEMKQNVSVARRRRTAHTIANR